MKFGQIAVESAAGAILAHSVRHTGGVFKKGRTLSAMDIQSLAAAGVTQVFAAKLESTDVPEDEAAWSVARAAAGPGTAAQAPFTGRSNLHAAARGLVLVDVERVHALNRLHESLTIATLASHTVVDARQMVATVKVIPFAVPRDVLLRALTIIGTDPLLRVEAFRHRRAGLVITRLPETKPSIVTKSEQAMRDRIVALDGSLTEIMTVEHEIGAVEQAIRQLHAKHCHPLLVFGASAIVDRGDIIPAALAAAGGEIIHLGMPVDPGNLMMYGRLEGTPVIGVPSCARSPKVNGFDWVLERVMAGVHVSAEDIMAMGAGGLLAEIPSRPSPREAKSAAQRAPNVTAIILAAGQSSRMGSNKLLASINGKPMIRHTVEAALASGATKAIVVTGRDAEAIMAALGGLDVTFVHNPNYADGISTSLRAGVSSLSDDTDAALICLGDMPRVGHHAIDRLIAAFSPAEHRSICVPVFDGRAGNPVLFAAKYFTAMREIEGDHGAKSLIARNREDVVEVAMPDDAVLTDIDTPEALEAVRVKA